MSINGWLVLEIALGILVGDLLREMFRDTRLWWNQQRSKSKVAKGAAGVDESEAEDWDFLWNNVPDSAKSEIRTMLDDDILRERARRTIVMGYLFYAASEDAREQLRQKWRAANVPPKVSE